MKLLSALQPHLVNIWAFLGGGIVGLFAGAALVSAVATQKNTWEILNSGIFTGIIGGIFTAIITGVATYIATRSIIKRPQIEALNYKIMILKIVINVIVSIDSNLKERGEIARILFAAHRHFMLKEINGNPYKKASERLNDIDNHECEKIEAFIRDYIDNFDDVKRSPFLIYENGNFKKTNEYVFISYRLEKCIERFRELEGKVAANEPYEFKQFI